MKKLELTLTILAIIALVLNLIQVPNGNALTVLTLSALAVFYMYLGFALFNNIPLRGIFKKVSYRGSSAKRIAGALFTGFIFSLVIMGILFKFHDWPGATFNIRTGVFFLLIVNTIGWIKSTKSSSTFYSVIFKRSAILGGFGLMLTLLPATTLLEIKYRNYPAYVDAYKKAVKQQDNKVLWDSVEYQRQVMEYSRDHD